MSTPAWSRPHARDPWWGRYAFYVTSGWGPWGRCVLGAAVLVLLVAVVVGALAAGVVLAIGHLAPGPLAISPLSAGLGGGSTVLGVGGITWLVRHVRRRRARGLGEAGEARGSVGPPEYAQSTTNQDAPGTSRGDGHRGGSS